VRNFKPNRWPACDPDLGLLNCDGSPTKSYLTSLKPGADEYRFYEMSFGKRPMEELYDMVNDQDCVHNLAGKPEHAQLKEKLWNQLERELKAQGDPRVLGNGDIFDFYPNCRVERQQKLYKRPNYDPKKIFERKYGKPILKAESAK